MAAVALIVVFACDEKESYKVVDKQGNDPLTVTVLDQKLKIEGAVEGLERIKNLLSSSSDFEVQYDIIGNTIMVAKKEKVENTKLNLNEEVFYLVENMPEFPGGESAMRKYISSSIVYPEEAVKRGVQGKVFVSFVVTKTGEVANSTIARGVDPALDKEALRVVNGLPKWLPGKQKGQVVNVNYTVPINFALETAD